MKETKNGKTTSAKALDAEQRAISREAPPTLLKAIDLNAMKTARCASKEDY